MADLNRLVDLMVLSTRDRDFIRNRYQSLPWRVSTLGHTTVVVPAHTWDRVSAVCDWGRNESAHPGSYHYLSVPPDWVTSVYEVGGFRAYLTGRENFVLSAWCRGLSLDNDGRNPTPVYVVKAVVPGRGTRVLCREFWARACTTDPDGEYWHLTYTDKRFREMPPAIVADYLQDHDHLVWTDERVAHLRARDWFSNGGT